jgi:hypothetical protein
MIIIIQSFVGAHTQNIMRIWLYQNSFGQGTFPRDTGAGEGQTRA